MRNEKVVERDAALDEAEQTPFAFLLRHVAGDWGDIPAEDVKENEFSLANGFRLFSTYHTAKGVKFHVITEWDRSVTTLQLPGEYGGVRPMTQPAATPYRIPGCESTNHIRCYGALWQCHSCGKTVCSAEGSDDCWVLLQADEPHPAGESP